MKSIARLVLVVLIAGLFLAALPAAPTNAQGTPETRRVITVTGVGNVSITPDVGYLRLGVDVANPDLAAALTEVRTKMDAVLAAIKAEGVTDADIRTDQYSVFREDRFAPGDNAPQPTYRVMNIVRVSVRDITKIGDVLNRAVEAGANAIQNVEFGVADVRPTETQARKLALTDAEARAKELAASIGATLGQVLSVQETAGFVPYSTFERGMGGGGGAGPINAGSLEVSVSLVVTYAIQ